MKQFIHPADEFPGAYSELLDKFGQPKEMSIDFLPKLDNRIWGLQKKKLVVVGGRNSMGKSAFMLQMAHSFATQGKKVVFFTLEMTVKTCILRMMNNFCGIDNWVNLVGMNPDQQEGYAAKLTEFQKHLEDIHLVFVESWGKTFTEIIQSIEGLKSDIDAVFIDYVQMIKTAPRQTDKQAIDEYIKSLREYAIKKDFCAVIGSQINRETYDGKKVKTPEVWELKGSGTLEEVMDLCFLVHWQYHYTREVELYNDYWIRVAKNREGRTGIFECSYEPQYYRIKEKDGTDVGTDTGESGTPYRKDTDS